MPMPPFPFPDPFGAMGGAGAGGAGERIEEEIMTKPDGTVCKRVIVWEGDKKTKDKTECGEQVAPGGLPGGLPDGLAQLLGGGRRLQFGGLPIPIGILGGEQLHNPQDDLWILGGVFLQHFVSIYDFEQERMGFCEPASVVEPAGLNDALVGVGDSSKMHVASASLVALFAGSLVALAALSARIVARRPPAPVDDAPLQLVSRAAE